MWPAAVLASDDGADGLLWQGILAAEPLGRTETHGGFVQKSRPTQNKRARERARQERQQHKAARRAEAKARKSSSTPTREGEDPDIAGIVPGPQPSPWGDELGDFEADSDTEAEEDDQ